MSPTLFNKRNHLKISVIFFTFFIFSCEKPKSAPPIDPPQSNCLKLKNISDKSIAEKSDGNYGYTFICFTSGFLKDTLSFVEQGFLNFGELNSDPSTGSAYFTVILNDSYITSYSFKLNNCVYIIEDIFSTPVTYITKRGNTLYVEHSYPTAQPRL
jgi:hypothetical protein